jgi:inner membrane transporter RhtA
MPARERAGSAGLVLTGIASVQIGSALATTLFDDLGPGGAVLLRTLFAALVLLAVWRPARAALSSLDRGDVALFAVVLALMNLCFYAALERLPLGIAVTLEFAGPLGVAILTSRRRLDLLWIALAAGGIALLAPGIGGDLDPLGVLFALGAAFFWGLYLIVSARIGRGASGGAGLAMALAIGTVLLLPVGVAQAGGALLDPRLLAIGFGVAMLASAIPYTVEMEALRRLPAGTVGVLLSLEPAVAALVGLIALDQGLIARELAAIALVMAASAGALSTAPTIDAHDP